MMGVFDLGVLLHHCGFINNNTKGTLLHRSLVFWYHPFHDNGGNNGSLQNTSHDDGSNNGSLQNTSHDNGGNNGSLTTRSNHLNLDNKKIHFSKTRGQPFPNPTTG